MKNTCEYFTVAGRECYFFGASVLGITFVFIFLAGFLWNVEENCVNESAELLTSPL